MHTRFQRSPEETRGMDTAQLRAHFLFSDLVKKDQVVLHYTHYDRMIVGCASPVGKSLKLPCPDELKAHYFLERRELGVINVGGKGVVKADGKEYTMDKLDCLYIGKETSEVSFKAASKKDPPIFYLLSAPAHHKYPTRQMTREKAIPVKMGSPETSNQRTIYKYIHLDGIKSCQLVMGLTVLDSGSVWNSVPPHTHTRRMEVYFYFDVPDHQRIFHFMGQPQETRHIVMANHEAVVSPPWSVHYGCGTSSYGFIWGMAGENQAFADMDQLTLAELH